MAMVPRHYWSGRYGKTRAVKALQWALKTTGHPLEEYPRLMTRRFFEEFKLTQPLVTQFQSNRFAFLDAAFPGKFRAWQFNSTPRGYFSSKENVVGAVRWLVEERLLIPLSSMTKVEIWDQKIAHKVTTAVFTRHGLGGLVQQYRSPESLLRLAYPDQFFPWSFRSCAKGKWIGKEGKKLAAQATRWLLDEYLMLDPDDPAVKPKIFLKNGLGGMLKICFKTDVRAAVLNAYPERIEKT